MQPSESNYWHFSRRERRAVWLLLVLIVLVWVTPLFYPSLPQREATVDIETLQRELVAWQPDHSTEATEIIYTAFDPNTLDRAGWQRLGIPERTINTILNYRAKGGKFSTAQDLGRIYNLSSEDHQRLIPYIKIAEVPKAAKVKTSAQTEALNLFPFDPNLASREELIQLGFPSRAAENLLRYRSKGGYLARPTDLQKIYALPAHLYEQLLPFVRIEDKAAATDTAYLADPPLPVNTSEAKAAVPSLPVIIHINQATAAEWQLLRGIGPVLSQRIVRFRDKLGGFYGVEQLAETYGLPDSTFQRIRAQLKEGPLLRYVYINSATEADLQAHPYISRQQARVIVAYRREHGPFSTAADLLKIRVLSPEEVDRLTPYLRFTEVSAGSE